MTDEERNGEKRCPRCGETKSAAEFSVQKNGYLHSWCRPCNVACTRAWERANPERTAANHRRGELRRRYGLSSEACDALLAAQGNCCAICRRPFEKSRTTHVDHDHDTGQVRGILCASCNHGLSCFGDNAAGLLAAVTYLDRDFSPSTLSHGNLEPVSPEEERAVLRGFSQVLPGRSVTRVVVLS